MDTSSWNEEGRRKNQKVCDAFEEIIERGGSTREKLEEDKRTPDLADAVLAEVVALNQSGKWQEARAKYDPAFLPFVPHMDKTDQGLSAVVILAPDAFLVRRGDDTEDGPVLHIDGGTVKTLEGVFGFGISRNRKWLALATTEGVVVSEGFAGKVARRIAWPEEEPIRPATFGVSDDGMSVLLASDAAGVWLARGDSWTKVMPRAGVGDEDEPDVVHAAISPDGKLVAYGWQDAPGHYVDDVSRDEIERIGVVGTVSDTPYHVLFSGDSKSLLSNTRHMQSGVTVCVTVESIRGTEEYDDVPDDASRTDEYLRAYGMVILPGKIFGAATNEDVVWIGGAGWSHAAPISGGKPVFTQLLGSSLAAFDYDPVSNRVAIASASSVLHVLDPSTPAEPGRERGYKPRRELYRWIFWDTLDAPIRW